MECGETIAIDTAQSDAENDIRTSLTEAGAAGVELTAGDANPVDRLIRGEVPAAVLGVAEAFPEVKGWCFESRSAARTARGAPLDARRREWGRGAWAGTQELRVSRPATNLRWQLTDKLWSQSLSVCLAFNSNRLRSRLLASNGPIDNANLSLEIKMIWFVPREVGCRHMATLAPVAGKSASSDPAGNDLPSGG
jgi:hypothetical protein